MISWQRKHKTILIRNWQRVLARALSMWCVYLAGIVELLPQLVPYLDDYIPPWLSFVILMAAPAFRVIKQEDLATGDDNEKGKKQVSRRRGRSGASRVRNWIHLILGRASLRGLSGLRGRMDDL